MDRRRLAIAYMFAATALAGRASAHGGSLGADSREALTVPTWLFLTTGGAVVGASFLLASFVTDRSLVDSLHDWGRQLSLPGRRALRNAASLLGIAGLVVVVAVGFLGPATPVENAGYLLVWVGWWAGVTMVTYLVGNPWPALNPWRAIARVLPTQDRPYPARAGAWPAVAGILAVVWLEIVGPPHAIADALPQTSFLASMAVAYSVLTLAGAVRYGDAWFEHADPVSRVFQLYGAVAPLSVDDDGANVRLFGTGLADADLLSGTDEVAFVVALLWATTFDGLVSTPAWETLLGPFVVLTGLPPRLLYLVAMAGGFGFFLGIYWLAVWASRRTAATHATPAALACWFAPPLLAIAAGYHLAHYLGYFLQFAPALVESMATPLTATGSVLTLAVPDWFGGVGMAAILLGHLLAIWVAHATAFDRFPGRLQAIRSQYPFVAVMVVYTMTSLWILSQPVAEPPYL